MLSGMKDLNDRYEMIKLIIKRTAEKRTINSGRILTLLENDQNQALYNIVNEQIVTVNGARLSIKDLKTYLELSIHDADGQAQAPIGISTDPDDPTTQVVSQETYDGLKDLAISPFNAEQEAKAELDKRKIY